MKLLKSIDIFDRSFTLKFRSESKYRTYCGGILTIIIITLMVTYFALLIVNPREKTTESTSSNSNNSNTTQVFGNTEFDVLNDFRIYNSHKTMTDDSEEYNLTASGWNIAVHVDTPYNSSLFEVNFYARENEDGGLKNVVIFPTSTCNETNFPIHLLDNFTEKDRLLEKMFCPDLGSRNIILKGDPYSNHNIDFIVDIKE